MGLNKVKRSSEIRKSLTVLLSLIEPRWVRKVEANIKRQPWESGLRTRCQGGNSAREEESVLTQSLQNLANLLRTGTPLMSTKLKSGGSVSAIISP